jgi:hypothetical protein
MKSTDKHFGDTKRRGRVTPQVKHALLSAVVLLNDYRERHGEQEPTDASGMEAIEAVAALITALARRGPRALQPLKAERAKHVADGLEALIPALRNLDQLHRCAICTAWFVPSRVDQKCCPPPEGSRRSRCVGVYRTRKWREHKDRYRDNRKVAENRRATITSAAAVPSVRLRPFGEASRPSMDSGNGGRSGKRTAGRRRRNHR